jgi:hypothetical protein
MAIGRFEVRAVFTEACPPLEAAFAEADADRGEGDVRLPYLEIAAVVRELAVRLHGSDTACFESFFAAVERCLLEGDHETVEMILVGLLEDLQNSNMTKFSDFTVWEPHLGPTTARGWRAVAEFWAGDVMAISRFRVVDG